MRAVVVYESMYGNTHEIASRVADGLRPLGEVNVVPVAEATADLVHGADLLVVGGPTHVHGMTSTRTRRAAVDTAAQDGLTVDPAATGPGLREWIDGIASVRGTPAAVFDTRMTGPSWLTGRASRGIARRLRRRGYRMVEAPTSFQVSHHNKLEPHEGEHARAWGATLASAFGGGS